MKVRFVQSGGFMGIVKAATLDTETMPADEAKRLEQLVRDSGLQESGTFLSEDGRDLQQYEITVTQGKRQIAVVFDDETLPQKAKPLVGYLKKHARPAPLD